MFIRQAFKPQNEFWKYLVGSVIVITASFLGQLPLLIAVTVKVIQSGGIMPTNENALLRTLDLNFTLFLLLFSFLIALIALIIVVKKLHLQRFKDIVTSREKIDKKRIFFSFSLWAIFSIVSVVLTYYFAPEQYVLNFNLALFAILFVIAVIMIPIQTSVEELIFRGYLMQGFGILAKNKWFPLIMTSLVFGVMHLANPEVAKMGYAIGVYYIGTGLFLGIMTLMDEGTELALGFHAANNLVAALLVTADWTVFQTYSVFKDISEPSAGLDILLPVLIIFPIILFIFSKKYNWTNWKEKLTGKIEPMGQKIE